MSFKNVMFLILTLQVNLVSAKNDQKLQFTGYIFAVSESITTSNRDVTYTVGEDAIQRVEYQSDDEFHGLIAYPDNDKVVLFVRSESKKYYTTISISEYLSRINKYKKSDYVNRGELLGSSEHFKKIYYSDYEYTLDKTKSVLFLENPCTVLQYSRPVDGFRERYDVVHCDSINIPRQWLNLTDVWIDNAVTGFPFQVKNYSTDEYLETEVESGEKNHVTKSPGETGKSEETGKIALGAVWNVAKQGLSAVSRGLYELGEDNYRVKEVVAAPASETSFIDLRDFIEVKTIDDFQQSLSRPPALNDGSKAKGSRFTW